MTAIFEPMPWPNQMMRMGAMATTGMVLAAMTKGRSPRASGLE